MSDSLPLPAVRPIAPTATAAAPKDSPKDYEVRSFASLAALREAAPGCCADGTGADTFFTPAWFENLAQHGLPADAVPQWLLVRRGDTREGANALCLPLMRQTRAGSAVYGPVLAGLSTYYSSLFAPSGDPALVTQAACQAIVRHLASQRGRPGVIDLQPLDTDSSFYRHMQTALQAEGWWVDTYFCFGNWHLVLDGRSFEAYYPGVPSRLRNTIRRGRKKLDDGGAWTLQVHAAPGPALDQAIADFDTIYRKSWKVPEPFPEFVPGLCRTAARMGWLRLGVVRLGDVPIAAQLWLVRDGMALIYKLAYDEEFKRFSAGSVLSAEMMRRAIDDEKVLDIDYLTGDDGYKADWMSHRRERRGIVAFDPRRPQGLLSAARHFAGRAWARHKAARAARSALANPPAPSSPAADASADA